MYIHLYIYIYIYNNSLINHHNGQANMSLHQRTEEPNSSTYTIKKRRSHCQIHCIRNKDEAHTST